MKAQQTLSLEREEHKVKLCSLENSLTLSRKTNQDHEVSSPCNYNTLLLQYSITSILLSLAYY